MSDGGSICQLVFNDTGAVNERPGPGMAMHHGVRSAENRGPWGEEEGEFLFIRGGFLFIRGYYRGTQGGWD
jgi:hypothetical protein